MTELMTTICNSICLILEAISRFDIMAVDTNRLAQAAQLFADLSRTLYTIINILVVIYGGNV